MNLGNIMEKQKNWSNDNPTIEHGIYLAAYLPETPGYSWEYLILRYNLIDGEWILGKKTVVRRPDWWQNIDITSINWRQSMEPSYKPHIFSYRGEYNGAMQWVYMLGYKRLAGYRLELAAINKRDLIAPAPRKIAQLSIQEPFYIPLNN
ncbi:MAG: hypothetical protein F6K24_06150 [Okeania sp. SIO2D1]|nr:hypothetical protein [Okeania sp. SIO2D1]